MSFQKLTATGGLIAAVLTSPLFGTLVPMGIIAESGTGLGAVNSLVTFQNTGTEVGAVGVNSSGETITGSSVAYFGSMTATAGDTHEITGAGNNVYTLSALGASSFSEVVLIFNGNEVQSGDDPSIMLDALSLNLFSPTGTLLGSFGTASGDFYTAFPGTGNAGFGYQLDATQAAEANALLAANPDLLIGGAASASLASDGPETVYISTLTGGGPGPGVPDSGATAALLGLALIGLGATRRFLRL